MKTKFKVNNVICRRSSNKEYKILAIGYKYYKLEPQYSNKRGITKLTIANVDTNFVLSNESGGVTIPPPQVKPTWFKLDRKSSWIL